MINKKMNIFKKYEGVREREKGMRRMINKLQKEKEKEGMDPEKEKRKEETEI